MPSPPTWIALGLILLALLIALVLGIDLKRCISRLETLDSPEQIAIYRSGSRWQFSLRSS